MRRSNGTPCSQDGHHLYPPAPPVYCQLPSNLESMLRKPAIPRREMDLEQTLMTGLLAHRVHCS
eukprot:9436509-Karenia_brevis.AAC.1